jgi:lipid II:glycine glycyltransferase (peptidoglycan interpeptide bridge formation enzyme)
MRYKDNVLNKLNQADALVNRLSIQLNRNVNREETMETLTMLKEQIESTREMVSIESDDFEQQFRPQ